MAVAFFCSTARAEYGTPPFSGYEGMYKNPDGTWTLWKKGETDLHSAKYKLGSTGEKFYHDSEVKAGERVAKAMEIDTGNNGQTGSIVSGISETEALEAKRLDGVLETGHDFVSIGEREIGEDLIAKAEADGVLADGSADVATALAGGAATLFAGTAVAIMGVEIGNGVRRIFGLPGLCLPVVGCGPLAEPSGSSESNTIRNVRYMVKWDENKGFRLAGGEVKTCKELEISAKRPIRGSSNAGEKCPRAELFINVSETWEVAESKEGKTVWVKEGPVVITSHFATTGSMTPEILKCEPDFGLVGCYEPLGGGFSLYLPLRKGETFKDEAFPTTAPVTSPGIKTGTPTEITRPGHITSPAPVTPVEHWPKRHEIEKETEKTIMPGYTPPEGEPEELPNPLEIEIPQPLEHETGTQYKKRIEEEGIKVVTLITLPETETDPSKGTEGVVSVKPAVGTHVTPDTNVEVDQNPSTGVPVPGLKIGTVTEPEIKLPKLTILCTKMPFGLPCWIVQEIEAWSSTSKAPVFTIGPYSIKEHEIPAGSFHLVELEPIMVKVRPFMVIFGTIGLVLLFYKLMVGGSPSGGSGGGKDESED